MLEMDRHRYYQAQNVPLLESSGVSTSVCNDHSVLTVTLNASKQVLIQFSLQVFVLVFVICFRYFQYAQFQYQFQLQFSTSTFSLLFVIVIVRVLVIVIVIVNENLKFYNTFLYLHDQKQVLKCNKEVVVVNRLQLTHYNKLQK